MIENDFYEKSMERKERFYKLINDFILYGGITCTQPQETE